MFKKENIKPLVDKINRFSPEEMIAFYIKFSSDEGDRSTNYALAVHFAMIRKLEDISKEKYLEWANNIYKDDKEMFDSLKRIYRV